MWVWKMVLLIWMLDWASLHFTSLLFTRLLRWIPTTSFLPTLGAGSRSDAQLWARSWLSALRSWCPCCRPLGRRPFTCSRGPTLVSGPQPSSATLRGWWSSSESSWPPSGNTSVWLRPLEQHAHVWFVAVSSSYHRSMIYHHLPYSLSFSSLPFLSKCKRNAKAISSCCVCYKWFKMMTVIIKIDALRAK